VATAAVSVAANSGAVEETLVVAVETLVVAVETLVVAATEAAATVALVGEGGRHLTQLKLGMHSIGGDEQLGGYGWGDLRAAVLAA
jgi:hypothetical protein